MAVKKVTKFQNSEGELFDSLEEAQNSEKLCELETEYENSEKLWADYASVSFEKLQEFFEENWDFCERLLEATKEN